MLTREPTLKEAMDFLELNAYEGSNAITTLRMGDIEEILKPIRKLVNEHFNPQPYKFEDLKVDMWVWNDDIKKCTKIIDVIDYDEDFDEQAFLIVCDNNEYESYEENRFYPLTKALQYQEKEVK